MTNYISFSLYGDIPKYLIGAVRNLELAQEIYPDWKVVFFLGESVPISIKTNLRALGAKVIMMPSSETPSAMLWRYQALFFNDAERVIFRDADSRVSIRESELVCEWIASGKDLHIIRDHPNHTSAILGGLWGCKAIAIRDKLQDLPRYIQNSSALYGFDQEIIRKFVYRDRSVSRLVHDGFFLRELLSVSPKRNDASGTFLGEVFNENDVPDWAAREDVNRFWQSAAFRLKTQIKSLKNIAFDFAIDAKSRISKSPTRKPE